MRTVTVNSPSAALVEDTGIPVHPRYKSGFAETNNSFIGLVFNGGMEGAGLLRRVGDRRSLRHTGLHEGESTRGGECVQCYCMCMCVCCTVSVFCLFVLSGRRKERNYLSGSALLNDGSKR